MPSASVNTIRSYPAAISGSKHICYETPDSRRSDPELAASERDIEEKVQFYGRGGQNGEGYPLVD